MVIYSLFLQHIIYSLKPSGKAAVVVPTGFITAQSGIDKSIREYLVEKKCWVVYRCQVIFLQQQEQMFQVIFLQQQEQMFQNTFYRCFK